MYEDEEEDDMVEVCGINVLPGLVQMVGGGWILAEQVNVIKRDGVKRTHVWLVTDVDGDEYAKPTAHFDKTADEVAHAVSRALLSLRTG